MKKTAAILTSLVIAGMSCVPLAASAASSEFIVSPVSDENVSASDMSVFSVEVMKLVNKERVSRGLPAYKVLPELIRAADIRAKETVKLWDHTRPDGRGGLTVVDDLGLEWNALGENIAKGQTSPASVMNGWMNSNDHRASILSRNFQYFGVGVAYSGGMYYWTQVFMGSSDNFPVAYYPEKYGDTNNDGKIDSIDASLVLKEYAATSVGKPYTLKSSERARSMLNGDNKVDSVDASIILKIYAKNST
ncbi:CAP domain-containing protein [Ruminococcus flavefaciens]|uniref:Cysteine-rich secretory protein family protein n=1 Tax=Ruminococcus flavefaciens TaxID=1265 RepID=A0A1M7LJQ8_RUMFL|nr:CAP domain-containing protein [Ruminococcus flavefaciens]SHM77884.1 Cysteine-rich secretory protein family protein [Ruminococcus flavefaciens]